MNEFWKVSALCAIVGILMSISNAIDRVADVLENISANSNIVFVPAHQDIQKVAK